MKNISAKRIAIYGLLTAVAMIFGYVEYLLPLSFIAPGVKLGLANLICLYLICLDKNHLALGINVVRILLSALLFATPFSLLFSLTAGIFSVIVMLFAKKFKSLGVVGISVVGSAVHNFVQLIVANFTMGQGVWFYLPFLLTAGTVAGALVGALCFVMLGKTKNITKYIQFN